RVSGKGPLDGCRLMGPRSAAPSQPTLRGGSMRAGLRAVRAMRGGLLLAGLLSLVSTGAAQAVPLTYSFTGGSAVVSATFGSTTLGSATIPLTGTQVT